MLGHKSGQHKGKSDDKKPVTMADMESKYNDIKNVIDGLMSSFGRVRLETAQDNRAK